MVIWDGRQGTNLCRITFLLLVDESDTEEVVIGRTADQGRRKKCIE